MVNKSDARRYTFLSVMFLSILLLASCSTASISNQEASEKKAVNDSRPYLNITLLVSDYSLPSEETITIKETLKKNLMGYYGLPEENAKHLIQNGSFELRLVEAGDERLDDDFQCRFYSSALITIWKSDGYFAICKSDHANFIPYITSKQEVSIEDAGSAWSDAEEGYLIPKTSSELISVVIGKTIAVSKGDESNLSSKLYLKRIPIAFSSYPVNEDGETYGSAAQAKDLGEAPDLIAFTGKNGTEGYVKKQSLEQASPKASGESGKQQTIQRSARRIPLYQSDGHTWNGFLEGAEIERLLKEMEI